MRREVLTALSRKEQESETAPHIITVLSVGALSPTESALPEPFRNLHFSKLMTLREILMTTIVRLKRYAN